MTPGPELTTTTARWTGADLAAHLHRGTSPRTLRTLMRRYTHPAELADAWQQNPDSLHIQGLPGPLPALPAPPDSWMLTLTDPDYPAALRDSPAPPLVLFGRGDRAALRAGLGVVGTRDMSAYGAAVVTTAVTAAAQLPVPIHSGLARGTDRAAAEAALEAGLPTVAVLATGPDMIYPPQHASLAEKIVTCGGAVVSEHPFGTGTDHAPHYQPAPLPARLMARNRIIAGLSAALVPAEASGRSGTIGTVWAALAADRPVIVALPRQHARTLPGAQAPLALASEQVRTEQQLRDMGAPAAVAARRAGPGPLASGVATDREGLFVLVEIALRFSPHYHP